MVTVVRYLFKQGENYNSLQRNADSPLRSLCGLMSVVVLEGSEVMKRDNFKNVPNLQFVIR